MDREEALGLLNAKLDDYRKMSYADLATRIGDEEVVEVTGVSGTEYQIEVNVTWDQKPNGDLRVMGTIDFFFVRDIFSDARLRTIPESSPRWMNSLPVSSSPSRTIHPRP